MLIVLLDEPGLFVFTSDDEAIHEIEPPEAEEILRAAFDDNAVPYRVHWYRPNRHGRWLFGLFPNVEHGEYCFVPAGPPDPAALIQLLEAHPEYTQPPAAKAKLDEPLARLRAG